MSEQESLTRDQLETICSEEGFGLAPLEWDKGLEHGIRQALECAFDTGRDEIGIARQAIEELQAINKELLQACEGLIKAADKGERSFYHAAARANAAIAKARGES